MDHVLEYIRLGDGFSIIVAYLVLHTNGFMGSVEHNLPVPRNPMGMDFCPLTHPWVSKLALTG